MSDINHLDPRRLLSDDRALSPFAPAFVAAGRENRGSIT
jgi:hypothetical protein